MSMSRLLHLDGLRSSMGEARRRMAQRRRSGAGALLGLALLIVVSGIAVALASGGYHGGFQALHRAAQGLLPDQAWAWVTRFGDGNVLFVLSLFWARRRPEIFWTLIIAALIGGLCSRGLKIGFDELRPPAVLAADQLRVIGPALSRHSFPSGHTLSAFLFAGVLFAHGRSWPSRLLPLGAAALVGISRVALGVHWPQDVIAGAFSGLMVAGLAVWAAPFWQAGLRPAVHLGLLVLPLIAMALMVSGDNGNPSTPGLVLIVILAGLLRLGLDYRDLFAVGPTRG